MFFLQKLNRALKTLIFAQLLKEGNTCVLSHYKKIKYIYTVAYGKNRMIVISCT